MKSKFGLITALCTSLYFIQGCTDNKTSAEKDNSDTTVSTGTNISVDTMQHMDSMKMNMDHGLMSSMNSMMDGVKNMKMTGDFDIDYANMMILHHQAAIDMSEKELSAGKDEKIKGLAQNIITSQRAEMEQLKEFAKKYTPSGMKHGEGMLRNTMDDMEGKMKSMQMSGDADKDFTKMMITHHEGAIDMAKKELANGMSGELKKTAKKTIDDQTKEIGEFRNWLEHNQ